MSNGNPGDTSPIQKPKKTPFFEDLALLMDKHRLADWAVVARAVDMEAKSTWIAGTGESVIEDEARGMYLCAKLMQLQMSIQDRWKPK